MSDKALNILCEIFPGVGSDTIQLIYDHATLKAYSKNTRLMKQGDPAQDTFYILIEGQADIYQFSQGENYLVGYLQPGQSFGELALIMDAPRNADIVATEPITVLEISRANFEAHIMNDPDALLAIVRVVVRRVMGQIDQKMAQLAQRKHLGTKQPEVFISYSRTDEAFARKLSQDLIKEKINVWMDVLHIGSGESWARQIGAALDTCKVMLLILSPDSMQSENVEDEWNYYLDKKKVVLPVLYRACDVPYRLHKLQYIDFLNKPYESSLSRVISDILMVVS